MNRRKKKKKKKGEEYKAPQELQRTETSIYRGGTRAEEWQASTLYLEHNCAHSNTNKHAQTYAYWYTFGKQFLSSSPLQYCFCSFFVFSLSSSLPSNLNIRGPKKKKKHLQPSTGVRARDGGREAAVRGQRGVVVCREECCLAYNLTSETQSVSVNKGLMLGGGCWQQINNVW